LPGRHDGPGTGLDCPAHECGNGVCRVDLVIVAFVHALDQCRQRHVEREDPTAAAVNRGFPEAGAPEHGGIPRTGLGVSSAEGQPPVADRQQHVTGQVLVGPHAPEAQLAKLAR
jgi:hypothetical protein